jgi:hypothetical protein
VLGYEFFPPELGVKDTAWQGTPLGWAEYYQRQKKSDEDRV